MSFASSRRTYDTDSIVLRKIFAYDLSNSPFSTGFVLTAITKGVTTFASPNLMLSTIGVSNLPAQLSTIEGQLVSTIETFYTNLPSSQEIFLPSTVIGLGTVGYVSTSYLISTIDGLGSIGYLSSAAIGTVVTSSLIGLGTFGYVSSTQLFSSVDSLASLSYISSSQLTSSIVGLGSLGFVSSTQLFSSLANLASQGYISSTQINSTVTGLATVGYVSSTQLTSTVIGLGSIGFLSTSQLVSSFDAFAQSTVTGLGSANYVSSTQLTSSLIGLGSLNYLSSASMFSSFASIIPSTTNSLGDLGYISTASLTSSMIGLGSIGYISTLFSSIRSTFSNTLAGNWCNIGFLYSNLAATDTVKTFEVDFGDSVRNAINLSTTNIDLEFKANLQFGYYDTTSGRYDFSTLLVRGTSLVASNIIGQENLSYYILNANQVNLPFFFQEKYRFLLNNRSTLSTLKTDVNFNRLSVFHRIGNTAPTTNQLFAFPTIPTSIVLSLDNNTTALP
jgi:hypothetical protein